MPDIKLTEDERLTSIYYNPFLEVEEKWECSVCKTINENKVNVCSKCKNHKTNYMQKWEGSKLMWDI